MMVLLVIIVYVIIRCIFIEPNCIEVTNYRIKDDRLYGIRVVFLTDFHLKRRDYKRLDKIVSKTNALNPDIVLLGGDFASGHSYENSMNIEVAAQKLSLINSRKYTVLGDNDWLVGGKKIALGLVNNGISVLENSNKRIMLKGRYVDIVGLADLSTRQPDIAKALFRTSNPRILLTHNPDVYYDVIDDVNLILAGHTHGGQFVIPLTPPLFVPSKFGSDFASGLITSTKNKMIISKGLGTRVLPVRLNCKPEIVVVDFER